MKVLIDVFGCDSPDLIIRGLALAINRVDGVTLVACGDKEYILDKLKDEEFDRSRLEILDAKDVITNEDQPVVAIRSKTQSSMVVALNELKNNPEIPVMISGGNTGALIAGSILIVGRETIQDRPTLITLLPNDKGGMTCLVDCGANVDCLPEHLVQFAGYANKYVSKVYNIESPKVALLSVGTEDSKGNAQTKEAFGLLKNSGLNFVGNVEARTVLSGDYDIVVADGFAGNILLKSIEGTTKTVIGRLMKFIANRAGNTDTGFVKLALQDLMHTIDFNSFGGAIILGAKKPVIKAHGSANSETVVSTVKQALQMVKSSYINN